MILAPRKWADIVFLWLALATVLTPALDPVGSPLRPTQGSAFNAFTSDVSLGPSRAAAPERERKYLKAANSGSDNAGRQPSAARVQSLLLPAPVRPGADAAFAAASDFGPRRFAAGGIRARAPPFS